jgi:hypothetical protein
VEQYRPENILNKLAVRTPTASHLFCPFTPIEMKISNLGKTYVLNKKRVIIFKVSTNAGILKGRNVQANLRHTGQMKQHVAHVGQ